MAHDETPAVQSHQMDLRWLHVREASRGSPRSLVAGCEICIDLHSFAWRSVTHFIDVYGVRVQLSQPAQHRHGILSSSLWTDTRLSVLDAMTCRCSTRRHSPGLPRHLRETSLDCCECYEINWGELTIKILLEGRLPHYLRCMRKATRMSKVLWLQNSLQLHASRPRNQPFSLTTHDWRSCYELRILLQ